MSEGRRGWERVGESAWGLGSVGPEHPRKRGAAHATDDVGDPSEEEQEGGTLLRRLEAALLGREVPERLVRLRVEIRVRLRLRVRLRVRLRPRLRLRLRLRGPGSG